MSHTKAGGEVTTMLGWGRFMKAAALGAAVLATAAVGGVERALAPDAKLWERWTAHDPASPLTVDHGPWDALLRRHLVDAPGVNRVRYAAFTAADRAALDAYLAALQATPVDRLARPEQMAFWINLYNALTVDVVLEHHPVASIRDIDISPGLVADGPWGAKLAKVAGERLSLNDIEHRILRPIWRDARIHYAVNCAAVGCPDLRARAWTAAGLDAALDAAARSYVNDPRGVRAEAGRLVVSKIYDWFHEDFGGTDAALLAHLIRYAEPALAEALRGRTRIDDAEYDWALNDAR
ncbi:DUF547 domain-containing protein [Rubrimonas cliftonensis]|uniref:DUF547 domain-containing protein n=1 Tax=Rubrimonas cliftonensis TaxID=89524 RepID=A0A1H4E7R8_9RHOB|nr:DUF547 domain-containing protein [Rubrimonas cliftonensis]SEA81124.1 Protein of unknown function, DUF547 [Rubrimonas cliftonensis]